VFLQKKTTKTNTANNQINKYLSGYFNGHPKSPFLFRKPHLNTRIGILPND